MRAGEHVGAADLHIGDWIAVKYLGQQTTQNRAALTQFSFRNFDDLRQQSRSFDRLAAYYNLNLTLTGDQMLPDFGLEGALVTGWSAAKVACALAGKKKDYLRDEVVGAAS